MPGASLLLLLLLLLLFVSFFLAFDSPPTLNEEAGPRASCVGVRACGGCSYDSDLRGYVNSGGQDDTVSSARRLLAAYFDPRVGRCR